MSGFYNCLFVKYCRRVLAAISKSFVLMFLAIAIFASIVTYEQIPAYAQTNEQCIYQAANGMIKVVNSRSDVPQRFRSKMRCRPARQERLAAPDEVTLSGNIRSETINTPLGVAELRWPRSVEGVFGRTPLRATVDSAKTVSRMIRSAAFSSEMQNVNLPWKIVFMDEKLSSKEIPTQLISNCHPGWMTPPANIYIVAQRVAAGCGGQRSVSTSVADSQLAEVLVHEMAHAVEYHMLSKSPRHNRMRAEGFATWFEQSSAQYSSFINGREMMQRNARAAAYAIQNSPQTFAFSGTAYDYARASMYFSAVEDKFGVRGVTRVYERMVSDKINLFAAIEKEFSWSRERLEQEVLKLVRKRQ